MEEQQPAVCPATFEARGKPIKTIKTPAFFWNHEERTSSLSELTEDPDRVNLEQEEATGDNVARNRMENRRAESKVSGKGNRDESSACRRSLLQRISNSAIALGKNDYFAEKSLFFADREAILVFGGVDPHEIYGRPGNLGRDIYRFRPEQNIWEFAGEMPEARHHHSVAYLMGRVYLVGGADPGASDPHKRSMAVATVWSYDPTNKTWTREPEMLTTRKNFGLVVSHGKMYALGGQDRNGIALNLVEAFDPSEGTWKEIQAMSIARVGPASIKYRELIWVAGGMTKSKKELFSRDVECYDPLKNLWLKAEPLRSPRCFASFYVMSEFLYVIGGASPTENGTESVATLDIWDSKLGLWKQKAEMAIPRHGHCTGSIGNQLLIIGGVTTAFMKTLNSVECYCYDLDKWMKGVASLPHAISGHGVVSLPPANLLNDR